MSELQQHITAEFKIKFANVRYFRDISFNGIGKGKKVRYI